MYENYVKIGDIKGVFPDQTLNEVCKANPFETGWAGLYWLCNVIELDVQTSLTPGSEELVGNSGTVFDFPELLEIGCDSFSSLSKAYGKTIATNQEFELLCYLFTSLIYKTLLLLCEQGGGVTKEGEVVKPEQLPNVSFHETIPNLMRHIWEVMDYGMRGIFEAFLHCQIIRAVDSSIIQHLYHDTAAMSEALEMLYAYRNCLEWANTVGETRRAHASKAAKARHSETDWLKEQVLQYYEENKHAFKSLRQAAIAIEKREPVKFRTIYKWLRER